MDIIDQQGLATAPDRRPSAAPPDTCRASVIIPTRNRKRLLRETLDAVWAQTLDPEQFEIIVADNCSSDGTREMMQDLVRTSPCRLVYHVMPENRGPARSRNTASRLATGRILAFTDDDCRPAPGWLERGLSAFTGNVALVTGTVRYKPEQAANSRFFCRASGEVIEEHPSYTWSNSFYRRDVFLDMQGSDESLCQADFLNRVVDCGDTDLAWRVKEAGYENRFVAESVVYHELQELKPLDWVLEPFRLYVVNHLVRRHPQLRRELLHWRLFFRPEAVWFYLMVAGLVLAPLLSPWFLLLALPDLVYAVRLIAPFWRLWNTPKMLAQIGFILARQFALSAGLLYGTFRYRTLVL